MKTCVYTYLFGSYDALIDQPVAAQSASDFICFTDDPELRSDVWRVVVVPPRFAADTVRSARSLKILGHPELAAYDATLSIDASVLLRRTPEAILEEWLANDVEMTLAHHSYRDQLVDEFDEIIRLAYDDPSRVYEQLLAYSDAHEPVLAQRPLWTGMIARRRTAAVDEAMQVWYDHVLRYSRRDQLSLPVAIAQTQLAVRKLDIDNFDSDVHEWPVIPARRISQGKATTFASGPLLAELRRRDRRITELQAELDSRDSPSAAELTGTIENLRVQIAQGTAQRDHLEHLIREELRESGRWRQRYDDTQGVTGASTNLVRSVGRLFRRR